ncbi:type III secretion system cytoplasmic ring protein SctQ [Xanthomonas cassavae CFBP 4642]|uniref:Type III secretion system cytoplasmic ring protein SctQ n=1 Tax=Xanthomonas cassavae CFBP 4642 TaxID=1219375 RepID=A0ABS8HD45_9XANT|nr:type III secretion system cytoplasmic ring protein SctQ [Xanthomonas cassavae]MCC4620086.1 type III secretion system cytoplasmic ring protein SctQ [Xanthomonas cassavae CFBP 4642]
MSHVPAARARLGRLLCDPRTARHCGFTTQHRGIRAADAARLQLELDGGSLELRIAARDGLALLLNEPDDALRVAIAGVLLSDELHAFAPLGLGTAEIVAFERCADAADRLDLGITLGRIDAIAETASPPLLAALQTAVIALTAPLPLPAWLSALRATTRLRIGQRTAPAALLQSLRTGDVLLHALAPPPVCSGELLWGVPGGAVLRASVRLNLQQMILETPPAMQHDTPEPDACSSATDVAALELPVHLEVDQLALSVSVLSGLQPGQILELSVPVDQADIRLVVYGQTIGIGRLLAVGEHLGVQILSMSETAHADA